MRRRIKELYDDKKMHISTRVAGTISFAAEILGRRDLLRTTFRLLRNEKEEMDAKDDNLLEGDESFLSMTRPLGATNEPTYDMAVKVDAILLS
ncbi:hypothetical protein PVK06_024624 [Gossypium arboreum]|uniref:Uncharacterized protein n=1 Tax=Gossypium arboreum TaxID=29729 RepID=A0ABR0PEI4_GOSAR|nr:hypothetical protein PVK06_024624 [Gossypium arboreum]